MIRCFILRDIFAFYYAMLARIISDCVLVLVSPILLIRYYCCTRRGCDGFINNRLKEFNSVFITGASSGVGKALALELAGHNVTLCLQGRNESRLDKVAKQCREKTTGDGVIKTYICDVRDSDAIQQCVIDADDFKPLDLIIANAGVSSGQFPNMEFAERLNQIFNTNVYGVLNTIFPIMPRFKERRHGHIAVMGSLSSYGNIPGSITAYPASKAALRFLCEVLRWSLKYSDVDVTCINPGYVNTPLIQRYNVDKRTCASGAVSPEFAAARMVDGLKHNYGSIDFPYFSMFIGWYLGGMHPMIRHAIYYDYTKEKPTHKFFPSSEASTSVVLFAGKPAYPQLTPDISAAWEEQRQQQEELEQAQKQEQQLKSNHLSPVAMSGEKKTVESEATDTVLPRVDKESTEDKSMEARMQKEMVASNIVKT